MGADDGPALTLGELVDEAARQLDEAGVEDAAISARRIGEAAAGVEPAAFHESRGTALTHRMVAHADDMLRRRAAGEPLQYVVGSWGFRRLDLLVDPRALIPRPETETVAGLGVAELTSLGRPSLAVDLGTGTGAIGLSLALEVPDALVHATDVSSDALALARANLAGLGRAGSRVRLSEGSWFDALDPALQGEFDLVISNPPYVADDEELPEVVAAWEPPGALRAGPDGRRDLDHLLEAGRRWVAPGGLVVLECAPSHAAALAVRAAARGYDDADVVVDLAGRHRAVVARRPRDEPARDVVDALRSGLQAKQVAVAPTDTVPGVLAVYSDEDAVRRVYAVKERPLDQPLPILVSGVEQAERVVRLSPLAAELAARHWPGGLTIVAERLGGPDPVHGRATLGVRAPAVGWLREVIDDVGPVTGSSANLHGQDTSSSPAAAAAELGVQLFVEGPDAGFGPGGGASGVPSTVIDATVDPPVVLREGAVEI